MAHPPMALGYRQIFILPTRFGWLLGLIMLAMLMGSLNFNNNLGLLTTFIVAGLAINSMLEAFYNLRGLGIRRCSAAPVFAGNRATLRVTMVNDERRQRPGLELVGKDKNASFALDYNQSLEVDIGIATRQRGWMQPGRLRIQTSQPLGLFEAWSWFWPERPFLVWPRPAVPAPPLPAGGGTQTGVKVRQEPQGEDFYSLRRWREGDPLHLIAWKPSQRHQMLLSREFRQEQSDLLELDLEQAPGRDLEHRISIVTAWVLQAEREQLRWTLRIGDQLQGPDSGPTHRDHCLRLLAEIP
jgi:uncharacterized protein (DUF58 family)